MDSTSAHRVCFSVTGINRSALARVDGIISQIQNTGINT